MAWMWRMESADGVPVDLDAEVPGFSNQGDAESWLGEAWRDLAEAGVEQVSLMDDDHLVYGPMSLSAD